MMHIFRKPALISLLHSRYAMGLPVPRERSAADGWEQRGVEGGKAVASPAAVLQKRGAFSRSLGHTVCFCDPPICPSLGRRNFFRFQGWRLPDETSLALPHGVPSPVVPGSGRDSIWVKDMVPPRSPASAIRQEAGFRS